MCLCEHAERYDHQPYPANYVFHPNERLHVYLDIRNTASKPKGDSFFTALRFSVSILDAANEEMWSHPFPLEDKMFSEPVPTGIGLCVLTSFPPGAFGLASTH